MLVTPKQKYFVAILLALTSIGLSAQRSSLPSGESSFEVSFGPSLLFGDIGDPLTTKFFLDPQSIAHGPTKLINSTISMGFHQELNTKWAYKISIFSSAYESATPDANNNRYYSDVMELAARGEYVLYRSKYRRVSTVFLHAGVGTIYSNYVVNPLPSSTVLPDQITAVEVPAGIGFRQQIFDKFKVGLDLNTHYVFNDLIDGRGVPLVTSGFWPHDITFNASVTVSYVIYEGNLKANSCKCEWY